MTRTRQQGFGAIAAIVILVVLAALAGGIVFVGTAQHTTFAQDMQSARAWQAARTGTEWGLFQALQPAGSGGTWTVGAAGDLCPAAGGLGHGASASMTLDLTASTGFFVTVTGDCWRYNEGESAPGTPQVVTVYQVVAVACPVAGGCPAAGAAAAAPNYIERRRAVIAAN